MQWRQYLFRSISLQVVTNTYILVACIAVDFETIIISALDSVFCEFNYFLDGTWLLS